MPGKWKRASKPKTRTGCSTCKIRHIKCDEEKPECAQCRKTGRKCDGYDKPPAKKSQNQVVARAAPQIDPSGHIVLLPGTREEQKYVHFFCTQTARAMSGVFQSELWDRLLPQISHSVPLVRHAVAAVSAAHEEFLCRGLVLHRANEEFALQQYNKAIKHLIEYMSSPDQTIDLTLITCYLFMCLEMLKGDNSQALNHLESGMRILHRRDATGQYSALTRDMDRELSHLSLRLNIQLSFHKRSMMVFQLDDPVPKHHTTGEIAFTQISEARHSLDRLMNIGLVFVREASFKKSVAGGRDGCLPRQQELCREFEAWKNAFERFLAADQQTMKSTDCRASLLLWIQCRVSQIWTETCLAMDEMIYDDQIETFEAIVRDAEHLVANNNDRDPEAGNLNKRFTLEAGVIPMLYWSAIKCRQPLVRRRALDVISRSPEQEGLWRQKRFLKVAEMVIELEEQDLLALPIEKRVPTDQQRVYESKGKDEKEASPCQITVLTRPNGQDKEWHCQTKWVHWE
ncbi:C6 zinc finger domain protein [Aspergillus steynii IBT 23096]|uniref:C6 zinc finger domain protein n=1 Tax=Aspergillus steynii IBT 23096 TaxID=1392250 RepID=A0A2I2G481_9EURO|nr:C6 zinc finger domain protein [Aspergillus steynii IBT 23096]PLB47685.1 C6 zinc finger domain protein [Aspergillus steynii IBT 23096]